MKEAIWMALAAGGDASGNEGEMEERMSKRLEERQPSEALRPAAAAHGTVSQLWLIVPFSILALSLGAALARLFPYFRWESLPVLAVGVATVAFALILNRALRRISPAEAAPETVEEEPEVRLDSTGPAVIAVNLEGRLIYCNPAAERLLGYNAVELMSHWSTAELLAPGEAERLMAEMQKICHADHAGKSTATGRLVAYLDCVCSLPPSMVPIFDLQLRRKSGDIFLVTLHVSALRNAQGELTGLVAVAVDQSAALHRDQAQRVSQERTRADELGRHQEILLDAVTDGICALDRNGKVSFANLAAARLLGAPADTLIGKSAHEILHCSAPPVRSCDDDCPLRRASAEPCSASGENRIFRADGTSFPAEYVVAPIRRPGHFMGSVLTFRDISQRYTLDRLKNEFISTVSHELRTPLTSIRGALGLLTSGMLGKVNEKAGNLLRIAVTNSDRLVRLINDILDLERIRSGRELLTFRSVQLAEIVEQAIEDMQPVADAAGVKLIHDTTQAEIAGDRDRLLQVITNLLSNAVKFSPANSTVSVMLRPGVTGVILSVIDHGRGIPADKLETIFGRFQQVDASDSRQKGGSGLGLAICRTIVSQHSGRIWAERNPLRGSTFRVFLPYHPAPTADSDGLLETERVQGTVVLADANEESRPRIAAQLARHGYSVVQAATVEQTLSAVRQEAQAILLDTALDGMNGWEILPLLRRLDASSRTPVVLLSVENPPSAEQLPSGVEGWVPKPPQEDALLAELARVLCGSAEKARILIVEDDRDLAHIISEVFARDSIAVQTAHSLKETIDACSSFRPHLIVLDIGLPDGDGFNVVDWLRQRENLARLPLVVYSGRDLSVAERRNLTLGPTYFLAKTRVQPQQLEALVLTMLRSSRQMEEAAEQESPVPNS